MAAACCTALGDRLAALQRPRRVGWGDPGRQAQERGAICIHAADSLQCMLETNTIVRNYAPVKNLSSEELHFLSQNSNEIEILERTGKYIPYERHNYYY